MLILKLSSVDSLRNSVDILLRNSVDCYAIILNVTKFC